MKKNLLLVLAICCATIAFAQTSRTINTDRTIMKKQILAEQYVFAPQSFTHYLTARISDDRFEKKSFSYDSQSRIICVFDSAGTEKVRDSIYYDANNNVTRVSGHQFLNGVWKNVYIVDYEYDANNNMIHRKNYNSMGTETFTQGGVYDYNYQNGHIVSHSGYMGDYEFLFETCDYKYDAQNRLASETYCQGFGTVDSSMKLVYEYGANGKVADVKCYYYDEYGWYYNDKDIYLYDAAGNCIEHSRLDAGDDYTDRKLYTYDLSVSSENIAMPYYIPELGLPEGFSDANMRTLESWHTLDAEHILQFVCNYNYVYSTGLSVEEMTNANLSVYPNPVQDVLTIKLDADAVVASVFDIQGRILQTTTCMAGVNYLDMSDYTAGVYFVKVTLKDGKTAVQKVVKK